MPKYITEKQIDLLTERLIERINKANESFLINIGNKLKKIKKLTPSQAQQLIQILKYGGNYEDITEKIAKYMNLNVKEVDDIFENYAKNDQLFNKQFYEYRNIPFVKYAQNEALKQQTMALANISKQEMNNFTRSNAIGYSIDGEFYNLRGTYEKLLDESLLNVSQGKSTFDEAMKSILTQIGGSGLRTLDYESGRQIRLDSMTRMHLKSGLRELHNENQQLFGEEFDADGVEISVHTNPADDHAEVQGRQFSLEEYEKLQAGLEAKDYKGKTLQIWHSKKGGYRPISQYNCYHYIFSIVLGVSKPEYSEEQLEQMMQENRNGFELDGKHYTNYEGTQMQRALERRIREQKDIQILAKASGNEELINESQTKITQLTDKYKELSVISGLPTKMDRLRVSGYKRTKVNLPKENKIENTKVKSKEDLLNKWNKKFENDNIIVKHILNAEPSLIDKQITQVDSLLNKYKFIKDDINNDFETNALTLQVITPDMLKEGTVARFFANHYIEFNEKYFKDNNSLYNLVKNKIEKKYWQPIDSKNYEIYPVTHEFGHMLEFKMIEKIEREQGYTGTFLKGNYMVGDLKIKEEISKKVPDMEKYISDYGKKEPVFEWFAETFTQMELGKETPLTKEFKKYINDFLGGNYEYFR